MKIICIGMNYSAHCAELENVLPTEPVFFMKPETALLRNNEPFYIPDFSTDLHYECELVVRINKMAKAVEEQFASRYYDEIGLGIDFTARDLQRICRAKGLPWEMAKSFDNSAAIAPSFINKNNLPQIQDLHFELTLNGEVKQKGFTGDMIFSVERIISYISNFVTLKVGDLIFTGTPLGVGAVKIGDKLRATLEGEEMLNFEIK